MEIEINEKECVGVGKGSDRAPVRNLEDVTDLAKETSQINEKECVGVGKGSDRAPVRNLEDVTDLVKETSQVPNQD